jgi:hypothetical protein
LYLGLITPQYLFKRKVKNMNTSAIGLFAKLNPTSHTNGIRPHENRVSDGGNESSRIPPANRGRPNDGRAFVHDVMESLNSLGLNLQGVQGGSASSGGNAEEVREALHAFLHDLHQVLNQNGGIQTTPPTGGGDMAAESSSSQSSGVQNGYSNVKTNLQDLITSLSEGTGDSGTLQTDFNNLVTALGGSTSETGLVDFLKQLDSTASNSAAPANTSGSILTAQA